MLSRVCGVAEVMGAELEIQMRQQWCLLQLQEYQLTTLHEGAAPGGTTWFYSMAPAPYHAGASGVCCDSAGLAAHASADAVMVPL